MALFAQSVFGQSPPTEPVSEEPVSEELVSEETDSDEPDSEEHVSGDTDSKEPVPGETVSGDSVAGREAKPYTLYLNPVFGVIYGHSEEIVFPHDTMGEYLSLLLWEMKPVYYYGLLMEFSRTDPMERRGFFSTLSLKFGIPGSSGNMENNDWMSKENDALTHYSIHDNTTKSMFLFDLTAGYAFPFGRSFLFKTYLNISYMKFSFFGSDGYGFYARRINAGIYHPIDDNPNLGFFYGKVINYTQEWILAAPAVSLGYCLRKEIFAEFSFMISPLILCVDLDEHLDPRYIQFRDYLQGGLFIDAGLLVTYRINERLGFSIDYSRRYISGTKGAAYERRYGVGDYTPAGMAGSGLSVSDISLLLKIRM